MNNISEITDYLNKQQIEYFQNEPLSAHTTFKIGGNADLFLLPKNAEQLQKSITVCRKYNACFYILGNGSNVLFSDCGFRGAIISTNKLNSKIELIDKTTIKCDAGIKTSQLCLFALEHSVAGFEFLWGIPGTMGGALYMNAGAYGGEIKDVAFCAEYINKNAEITLIEKDKLDLSYRHSVFEDNCGIISSVTLKGCTATKNQIKEKMDDLIGRRKAKQPLEYPSAGSTFKRPPNNFAAALIEQCGLKGCKIGGAMVSEKHSGFIINHDNATCQDVLNLVKHVQQTVYEQTQIKLECEIRMVK